MQCKIIYNVCENVLHYQLQFLLKLEIQLCLFRCVRARMHFAILNYCQMFDCD
jgi:hypothetical protein